MTIDNEVIAQLDSMAEPSVVNHLSGRQMLDVICSLLRGLSADDLIQDHDETLSVAQVAVRWPDFPAGSAVVFVELSNGQEFKITVERHG